MKKNDFFPFFDFIGLIFTYKDMLSPKIIISSQSGFDLTGSVGFYPTHPLKNPTWFHLTSYWSLYFDFLECYSYAMVLYEMFSGKVPFEGKNPKEVK